MKFIVALAAGIQACAGTLATPCQCPRVGVEVGPGPTLVSCAKLFDAQEPERVVLGLSDLDCGAYELPIDDEPEKGDESL